MSDDGFSPVAGKCAYWREHLNEDDRWDSRIRKTERRVTCSCFVEGNVWEYTVLDVPGDCPDRHHCRYYVRNA